MAPFRVGLTGGIAAGKTTVASWLREAGLIVVDADHIVADLYRSGGDGAALVSELFGSSFLQADGSVDHPRLAAKIFDDPAARARLEAAIHPLVKRSFEEIASQAESVAVLEAPLLVEAGFAPDFDMVITVEADPATRIQRAVGRGSSLADAEARLAAQTGEEARCAAAHRVLRNEGSLTELRAQVDILIEELRERAADES